MNVLIFGGAGFIGSNLSRHLLSKGHKVCVFDNLCNPSSSMNIVAHKNYKFVHGDIRNQEDFSNIPKDIDSIINLAGISNVDTSESNPITNIKTDLVGSANILEFSKNNGNIPVIYMSSNKVYSELINKIKIKENKSKTRYIFKEKIWKKGIPEKFKIDGFGKYSHSIHGSSKSCADLINQEYYHSYGVPTVILRTSTVYGENKYNQDNNWLMNIMFCKIFERKLKVYGNGMQVRDVLYVEDLNNLITKIVEEIEKFQGEVFNIGGGAEYTMSIIEAMKLIEIIDNNKHSRLNIQYEESRISDQLIYISDLTKISRHWSPDTKPIIGLNKTYNWILDNKEKIRRFIND